MAAYTYCIGGLSCLKTGRSSAGWKGEIMKRNYLHRFLHTAAAVVLTAAMLSGCASGDGTDKKPDPEQTNPKNNDNTEQTDRTTTDPEQTGRDPSSVQDDPAADSTDTETDAEQGKTIAISMPDQSAGRWAEDASTIKKDLESRGYQVAIQFAENDPKLQASQMEDFIASKADCMIVAAVDANELTDAADAAKEAGIPIIAYDRLLMDTDAVSFYTAFDHKGIGIQMGQAIVKKAGLDDLKRGKYRTIEFFMGPADDNRSLLLYDGLMEVLEPYLDDGSLVCKSGRLSYESACMTKNTEETAKKRCAKLLKKYYTDEDLSICAAASDMFAYGCKSAAAAAGYTQDNWPIISGQGCEIEACRNILEGTQAFSIHQDTRILAVACAEMADAVVTGTPPQINNTEQYDNHAFVVPSYVCAPSVADADNLKELLIGEGYYTQEELLES